MPDGEEQAELEKEQFGRMEKNRQADGTQESFSFPHFYRKNNPLGCRAAELGFEARLQSSLWCVYCRLPFCK